MMIPLSSHTQSLRLGDTPKALKIGRYFPTLQRFCGILPLKMVHPNPLVLEVDMSNHAPGFEALLKALEAEQATEVSGETRSDPRIFLGSLNWSFGRWQQGLIDHPVLKQPWIQDFLKRVAQDFSETLHQWNPQKVPEKTEYFVAFNRYKANPDPAKNHPVQYHNHSGLYTASMVLNNPQDYEGAQLMIRSQEPNPGTHDYEEMVSSQKQYHALVWSEAESDHGVMPITKGKRTMMALNINKDTQYEMEQRREALRKVREKSNTDN